MGLILKKSIHSQLYYCNPTKLITEFIYRLVQYVLLILKFTIKLFLIITHRLLYFWVVK